MPRVLPHLARGIGARHANIALVRSSQRCMEGSQIILLTTFRKQRNNERTEIARARKAAEACAEQYP